MPKNFDRMAQVNEIVRLVLAKEIPRVLQLAPGELITITRVTTSRDLGHAKVFVTIYPDGKQDSLLKKLQQNTKDLRHELSQDTRLFRVPELSFRIDETEKRAQAMDELLDSLQKKS